MSFELAASMFSIFVTLLLGLGVYLNARRSNKNAEKHLTVEEQVAEDEREDVIARRRREELDRLYARVEKLEQGQTELRDRLKRAEKEGREMLKHIEVLERAVPNPPGPPVRPMWTFV